MAIWPFDSSGVPRNIIADMQGLEGTITIIDDHQLFADGLELMLKQRSSRLQILKFASAEAALASFNEVGSSDLVLIDLNMPLISGFAFLRALQQRQSNARVAVISGVENRSDIEKALALGARGFIPKDASSSEMLEGISAILRDERFLPAQWLGRVDWPSARAVDEENDVQTAAVGERQYQVLKLLQEGLENKQIAALLGVSVSTIKSHTQSLYRTFNVTNRTACIKAASDKGVL